MVTKQAQVNPVPPRFVTLPHRGLKNIPALWMEEKAHRDQQLTVPTAPPGLWTIEGVLYDLSEFIPQHPGGPSWLQMTRGQDVTELFIIHHLREEQVRQQLEKYRWKGPTNAQTLSTTKSDPAVLTQSPQRFTFEKDQLYRKIKQAVTSELNIFEISNTAKTQRLAWIILFIYMIGLVSFSRIGNKALSQQLVSPTRYLLNEPSQLALLIVGLLMSILGAIGLIGVGHNFVHKKDSMFRYGFGFYGFSAKQWQIMHCMSHHIYPNTELDYENGAFEPVAYFLRTMPQNKWYTSTLLLVLFLVMKPINMFKQLVLVPIIRRSLPNIDYFLSLTSLLVIWTSSSLSLSNAFLLDLAVSICTGFVLKQSILCGHRIQELWTAGSPIQSDFAVHTLVATADTDIGVKGIFSLMFFAGFNIHIAHHLFPTVDHHALPEVDRVIKKVCEKENIGWVINNRLDCHRSISRNIKERTEWKGEVKWSQMSTK